MTKIKVLSEDLTNKIAAGEVVDRPAAVAKELLENSIDAGSDKITIILKDGGKALIQIVDNGTGMDREDAILSLQRHTTSKIFTYDDLHNIHSLGFRGEALASIASISRIELKTTTQKQTAGTLVRIDGGVIEDVSTTAGVRGTSIAVKNIFYNTPARRKFLKSNDAEYRYILNTLSRFTIYYHQIEFMLYHNDQLIFHYKPSAQSERLIEVLGARYQDKVIELNDSSTFVKISGYIGKQDASKKSRGNQYLYLNGRYIVNRSLNHAIVSAYGTIIPRDEYPLYVIFLELDPRRVDVNVHPSKMEVKFSDERLIYSILRSTVSKALASAHIIPHFTFKEADEAINLVRGVQTHMPLQGYESSRSYDIGQFISPDKPIGQPDPINSRAESQTKEESSFFERKNVWQIHNQYIISEIRSGIIIIDQHVAHERILYERALHNFEKRKPSSQQLLFPIIQELTPEDYSILNEILPYLEHLGFVIKGFGGNTVVIEGVPGDLKLGNEETILAEIIDEFKKNMNNSLDLRDNLAKSFSCKSAIKAGDKLTLTEMNMLIDQLFATQSPYFCPHGRPIIINISIDELNKRFHRT
ncbi:DNA mismatch repair endonuclease MutL [candidate division KSB1 bacterium]|nr:DNA mismatch repair endonuclease MutL [candidate division KSB1 bacterium]